MKINALLLKQLRTDRSWSQDELALAAGLNLRTIQRIERDGSASLQSKKALASALDVDVHDLDQEETFVMPRYEYKTIEIDPQKNLLSGITRDKMPDFASILTNEGSDGWKLIQILTPDLAQGLIMGKASRFVALLERQIA